MGADAVETRTFGVSAGEIAAIDFWIEDIGSRWAVNERAAFKVRLCVAELAANVLEHGKRGCGDDCITVTLRRVCDGIEIQFVDTRGAFDPTRRDAADPADRREPARAGGLGLRLLPAYADGLAYRNEGARNCVELKIRSSKPPV